jgi:hypothetical protein
MPTDKKVPVDKLHITWILEVLPKLDHLMCIFWAEFEPKNEQHLSSPHYYFGRPELCERRFWGNGKTLLPFQGIQVIYF